MSMGNVGFEIRSTLMTNNATKEQVVTRPPSPSHLNAMARPIIVPNGKKMNVILSFVLIEVQSDPSPPKNSAIKKNNTNANMADPHI